MRMSLLSHRATTRRLFLAAAMSVAVMLAPGLAGAQTIESLKSAGVLKVGSQVAQVPWGFTDA